MMLSTRNRLLGAAAAAALAFGAASADANTSVGLELSLLVDVSGSVSSTEYALQMQGYVQAFQSAAVQAAIAANPTGAIAVNLIQWSGGGEQVQSIGWTLINSAATANAFAAQIAVVAALGNPFSGLTAPGSAINFAVPLFASNLFDAPRQVIDVSGDGAENDGANTAAARNAALAAGIDAINGLPILGESGLLAWYQNNIQGGSGSFTEPAANFADFGRAVTNKLEREIIGVPEPMSLALFGMGLAGLGLIRRRLG